MHALLRSSLAVLLACFALAAAAQEFPARSVRIAVPFPPAGAAHLLTRALGKRPGELWNQPVVADKRPGAGGNIGGEAVAKSAPAGTPPAVIRRLNPDVVKALDSHELKEIVFRQGGEVIGGTPEQMATQICGDRLGQGGAELRREDRMAPRA